MAQLTQYGTASQVALAEPLQSLMIEAIRVVTGDASFHPYAPRRTQELLFPLPCWAHQAAQSPQDAG